MEGQVLPTFTASQAMPPNRKMNGAIGPSLSLPSVNLGKDLVLSGI